MNRNIWQPVKSLILAGLTVVIANSPAALAQSSDPNWAQEMQKLAQSFSNVFPFVYSAKELAEPNNRKSIEEYIKLLRTSAHTLPVAQGKALVGDDPIVSVFPKILQGEVSNAENNYKKGQFDGAQQAFKRITNQCFSCHITHRIGPKSQRTNSEVVGISSTLREKVIAFVALRQHESASALLKREIEKGTSNIDETIANLKLYLLIMIIGDNKFSEALSTVQGVIQKLPSSHDKRPLLTAWAATLKTAGQAPDPATIKSVPANLLSDAQALRSQGKDDWNYVSFLVLSRSLSLGNFRDAKPDEKALVYQALGLTYEALAVPEFFFIPWMYDEACVTASPKGPAALTCYRQAEGFLLRFLKKQKVNELPASVQKRLDLIRPAAEPAVPKAP